jgi:ubiquinone/menaquinone biosynthesis C-methylase UbiE
MADLPVATALDVGTGTGRYALKLARRGIAVTAIDQSPGMLAVARRSARAEGLAIAFCLGSLEEGLPFAPGRFDLVVCALMLCHVPDMAQAGREFYRAVRTGGYLLITDFHPGSLDEGWRTVVARPEGIYLLPNMPHTRADYIGAVEEAGFTVRDVRDVPVGQVPKGYLRDAVLREYGDKPLCLIILAHKTPTASK